MGISFDFEEGFLNLCDTYNFKPCRFADIIENHGCNAFQIHVPDNGTYVLYDIPFLLLAIVVGIVLMVFVHLFGDKTIKYKKQIPTRGKWFYRIHLILYGLSLILWAVALCFTSEMGKGQNIVFAIHYCVLNLSMGVLFYIALMDMHVLPGNDFVAYIICAVVALVFGLPIFGALGKSASSGAAINMIFGFFIPLGVPMFHFFSMLPILIVRKLWKGIAFLCCTTVCSLLTQILNVFVQGPICEGTSGYLTGASLGALICAFYRVFLQLYYKTLKDSEAKDDLPPNPKKINEMSTSELNRPFAIEISDYSYSYTYTDTDDFV